MLTLLLSLAFAFQTPEAVFDVQRFSLSVEPVEQTFILGNSVDDLVFHLDYRGPLTAGMTFEAELIGPGLSAPKTITASASGRAMTVAAADLNKEGDYYLTGIRLVRDGKVVAFGLPDQAMIEVIPEILVTSVQVTELGQKELEARGYLFSDKDYRTLSFQLALVMGAREHDIEVSLAVPRTSESSFEPILIEDPFQPPVKVVPMFELEPLPDEYSPDRNVKESAPRYDVFSLLLIPGDMSYLKKQFSVTAVVANVSPQGTQAHVTRLKAELLLPSPGDFGLPITLDGPQVRDVVNAGEDRLVGTADDSNTLDPGEEGSVEYLVRGEISGLYTVKAVISGEIQLPQGTVKLHSQSQGRVLVRPDEYTITMEHPDTVAEGDAYQIHLDFNNTGSTVLENVNVSLPAAALIGTTLDGSSQVQSIGNIAPGETKRATYNMRAEISGEVVASYFKIEGEVEGNLHLRVGIGESGERLTPYVVKFPQSFDDNLPSELVTQLRRYAKKLLDFGMMREDELPAGYVKPANGVRGRLNRDWAKAARMMDLGISERETAVHIYASWVRSLGDPVTDSLRRKLLEDDLGVDAHFGAWLDSVFTGLSGEQIIAAMAELLEDVPNLFLAVVEGSSLQVTLEHNGNYATQLGLHGVPFGQVLPMGIDRYLVWLSDAETAPKLTLGGSNIQAAVMYDGPGGRFAYSGGAWNPSGSLKLDFIDKDSLSVAQSGKLPEILTGAPVAPKAFTLDSVVQTNPVEWPKADRYGRTVLLLFSKAIDLNSLDPLEERFLINGKPVVAVTTELDGRIVVASAAMPLGPYKPVTYDLGEITARDGQTIAAQQGTVTTSSFFTGVSVAGRVVDHAGSDLSQARVFLYQSGYWELESNGVNDPRLDFPLGSNHHFKIFDETTLSPDGSYGFDFVSDPALGFKIGVLLGDGRYQERMYFPRGVSQEVQADFAFVYMGGVEGYVYDDNGNPIAGAPIYLVNQYNPLSAALTYTDMAGYYSAANIEVGYIQVKSRQGDNIGWGSGYLTAADSPVRIDVVIDNPVASFAGKVEYQDVAGNPTPIEGAFVGVLMNETFESFANEMSYGISHTVGVRTEADGTYNLDNIPPGQGRLVVYHPAYSLQELSVQLVEGVNPDQNITYSFAEFEGGAVTGFVQDSSGNPLSGARVSGNSMVVYTGANGGFTLDGIPLGRDVIISAESADGSASGSASVYLDLANRTYSGLLISLYQPTIVSGTLTNAAGEPMAYYPIAKHIEVSGAAKADARSKNGYDCQPFAYTDEYGNWSAELEWEPDTLYAFAAINSPRLAEVRDVFIDPADPQPVHIIQRATAPVSVQLLDAAGNPVVGEVQLTQEVGDPDCNWWGLRTQRKLTLLTDYEGRAHFTFVNTGPITLTGNSILLGQATNPPITLTEAGLSMPIQFDQKDLGSILGQVYNVNGIDLAPAGTKVYAYVGVRTFLNGPDSMSAVTEVNEQGGFIFDGLVETGASHKVHLIFYNETENLFAEAHVNMHGSLVYRQDVQLKRRSTVRTRVINSDGSPADFATVRLDYRDVTMSSGANGWAATMTKAGGTHQVTPSQPYHDFENVPSGPIRLYAVGPNGLIGMREYAAPVDGGLVDVTIRLEAPSNIRGIFLDHLDAPIVDAEVQLRRGNELLESLLTGNSGDDSGKFAFLEMPMRSYNLRGTDPLTGHRAHAEVRTSPFQPDVFVNLKLDPVIDLEGVLTDGNGAPVVGAMVSLTHRDFALPLLTGTDINGRYRFDQLRAGEYSLVATKRGINGNAAASVDLLGQTGDTITQDLGFERTLDMTVKVLQVDGTPAARVLVQVHTRRYGQHMSFTDDQGEMRLLQMPLDEYKVEVEDPATLAKAFATWRLTDSEPDQTERTVRFPGYGSIVGSVLDQLGNPLGEAVSVSFSHASQSAWSYTTERTVNTDIDGFFRIGRLPLDTPITLKAYNPITFEWDETRVTLTDHLEEQEASLTFRPSTSVSGTVTFSDGTPAANARVRISDPVPFEVRTDAQGAYTMNSVPTGEIELRAFEDRGYREGKKVITINVPLNGILVPVVNQDIVLEGIGAIDGMVRYIDGSPVTGGQVTAYDKDTGRRVKSTAIYADGSFHFLNMPLDSYELLAYDRKYGRETDRVDAVLATDGAMITPELQMPVDYTISGQVLDALGAPVVDAVVEVWYFKGSGYRRLYSAATNDQGYYQVSRVFPGQYRLEAYTRDKLYSVNRTLLLDSDKPGTDLLLEPRAWILGTVYDQAGLPFNGGTVTVTQNGVAFKATVEPDGEYYIDGLRPGAYDMDVSVAGGWVRYQDNGFLAEGQNSIPVETGPTVSLSGQAFFNSVNGGGFSAYLVNDQGIRRPLTLDASGQFTMSFIPAGMPVKLAMSRMPYSRTVVLGAYHQDTTLAEAYTLDSTPPVITHLDTLPATVYAPYTFNFQVVDSEPDSWIDPNGTRVWLNGKDVTAHFTTTGTTISGGFTTFPVGTVRGDNYLKVRAYNHSRAIAEQTIIFNADQNGTHMVVRLKHNNSYVDGSVRVNGEVKPVTATQGAVYESLPLGPLDVVGYNDNYGYRRNITVNNNEFTQYVTLDLEEYADYVGRVLDPDGQPAAGYPVHLVYYSDVFTETTDAAGNFSFDYMELRQHDFFVDHNNLYVFEDLPKPIHNKQVIVIGDVTLQGRGTVTGTVYDSDGITPMPNLTVTLQYEDEGRYLPDQTTVTDASGYYSLADVWTYPFVVSAYDPVIKRGGSAEDRINFPGQILTKDLTLSPTGTITGILLDPTDQPAAGETVTFEHLGGSWYREVATDANGQFSVEDAPRSHIRVAAVTQNQDWLVEDVNLSYSPDQNRTLRLKANALPTIDTDGLATVWDPDHPYSARVQLRDDYALDYVQIDFSGVYTDSVTYDLGGYRTRAKTYEVSPQPTLAEGPMTITVTVADKLGAVRQESVLVDVRFDADGPTIAFAGPAEGAIYNEGDPVTVEVTLTDPSGVNRAEFYLGDELLGTDNSSPFQLHTFAPDVAVAQDISYTIRAYDQVGFQSTAQRTIHVLPVTTTDAPDVNLISPVSGIVAPISMDETELHLPLVAELSDAEGLSYYEWRVNGEVVFAGNLYGKQIPQNLTYTIPENQRNAGRLDLSLTVRELGGLETVVETQVFDIQGTVLTSNLELPNWDTSSYDGQSLILVGGTHTIDGEHQFTDLVLVNGAVLTQTDSTSFDEVIASTKIKVDNHLALHHGTRVDVRDKGYHYDPVDVERSIGSFAGLGRNRTDERRTYGSPFRPVLPGAWGGGGAIKLEAADMWIVGDIDASIKPVGNHTDKTGGSIWVIADRFHGKGSLIASGRIVGDPFEYIHHGSGGRIAIYGDFQGHVEAYGGSTAGAGTIYRRIPDVTKLDGYLDVLEIANKPGSAVGNSTPIPALIDMEVGVDVNGNTIMEGGQPVAVLDVADPNLLTPGSYIGHHISKAGEYETSAPVAEQNLTQLRSAPGESFGSFVAGDRIEVNYKLDEIRVYDGGNYHMFGRAPTEKLTVENAGLSTSGPDADMSTADVTFTGNITLDGNFSWGRLTLDDTVTFTLTGDSKANDLDVLSGVHTLNGSVTAANTINIAAGATLQTPYRLRSSSLKLHASHITLDGLVKSTDTGTESGAIGSGHGGLPGGDHRSGQTYGSLYYPTTYGNADYYTSYAGGHITMSFDRLDLNGTVDVRGLDWRGSAGSILLDGNPGSVLAGGGVLDASVIVDQKDGGGGRIAVLVHDITGFTGQTHVQGTANPWYAAAGAGTVYFQTFDWPLGKLLVDNAGRVTYDGSTLLPGLGTRTADTTTGDGPVITGSNFPNSLKGLYVAVDGYDPVRIASNTSTELYAEEGQNFPPLAAGDTYAGLHKLNVLEVRGEASFYSPDPIELTEPALVTGGADIGGTVVDQPAAPAVYDNTTVTLIDPNITSLTLNNNAIATAEVPLNLESLTLSGGSQLIYKDTVNSGAVLVDGSQLHSSTKQGQAFTATSVTLTNGSVWTVADRVGSTPWILSAHISGALSIDATSTVTTTGENKRGTAHTPWSGSNYATPSHGGFGQYKAHAYGNNYPVQGSFADPKLYGGENGGGVIHITADTVTNEGSIIADGFEGPGGSIQLRVNNLTGAGLVSAMGGDATYGEAGGRIAVYYNLDDSFRNTMTFRMERALAETFGSYSYGGSGTLFLKGSAQTHGELIVDAKFDQMGDAPENFNMDAHERMTGITGPAQLALSIADDDADPTVIRELSWTNLPPGLAGLYARFDDGGTPRFVQITDNTFNSITLAEPVSNLVASGTVIDLVLRLDRLTLENGAQLHFKGIIETDELVRSGDDLNSVWCRDLVTPDATFVVANERLRLRMTEPDWSTVDVQVNNADLFMDMPVTIRDLAMVNSTMTHSYINRWTIEKGYVDITARHVTLDADSAFNVDNKVDLKAPNGSDNPHGGYSDGITKVYGSVLRPATYGPAYGGGRIELKAETISGGRYTADVAAPRVNGNGSGGSVWLEATTITGNILATADSYDGGRVALIGNLSGATYEAHAYTLDNRDPQAPGSVFVKDASQAYGTLSFPQEPGRTTADHALIPTIPLTTLDPNFTATYDLGAHTSQLSLPNLSFVLSDVNALYSIVADYTGYELVVNGDTVNTYPVTANEMSGDEAVFTVTGDLSTLMQGDQIQLALRLDAIDFCADCTVGPDHLLLLDDNDPWLESFAVAPLYDGKLMENEPLTVSLRADDHVEVATVAVTFNGTTLNASGEGPHDFVFHAPATGAVETPYTISVTVTDTTGNTFVHEPIYTAAPAPEPAYEVQFITNTGAETGLDGWVIASGSWWSRTGENYSMTPFEGDKLFMGELYNGATEIYREIDVTAYRESIDTGSQSFLAEVMTAGYNSQDRMAIAVDYLDKNRALISSFQTDWVSSYRVWVPIKQHVIPPLGTRHLRLRLISFRGENQTTRTFFDAVSLVAEPRLTTTDHDLEIGTIIAPANVFITQGFDMVIPVHNPSPHTETDVGVHAYDDTTGLQWSTTIPSLGPGETVDVVFTYAQWDDQEGVHSFRAVVDTVTGETDSADNTVTFPIEFTRPTPVVNSNLLVNGNFDDPPQVGWTTVSGNVTQETASIYATAIDGDTFAGLGTGAAAYQQVNVSAFSAAIDAGTQRFGYMGYLATATSNDYGSMAIEFLDADFNSLGISSSDSYGSSLSSLDWHYVAYQASAPAGTRAVRLHLYANLSSTPNGAYFDALYLAGLSGAQTPPAPLVYYRLDADDIAGGQVMDSMGLQNGVIGAADSQPGIIGDALHDNGGIQVAAQPAFDFPGNRLSFQMWLNADAYDNLNPQLMGKAGVFRFYRSANEGRYVFEVTDALDQSTVSVTSPGDLGQNKWHHLVGVYDGAELILYYNGQPFAHAPFTGNMDTAISDLWVGDINHFQGSVDEVGLWNVALTPDHVIELHRLGREGAGYGLFDALPPVPGQGVAGPLYLGKLDSGQSFQAEITVDDQYPDYVTADFNGQSATVNAPGPYQFNFTAPAPATVDEVHTVTFTAYDQSGNSSTATLDVTVRPADTENPVATVVSPVDGSSIDAGVPVEVTIAGADNQAVRRISATFNGSTREEIFTDAETGPNKQAVFNWLVPSEQGISYTLDVTVEDRSGNLGTTSATYTSSTGQMVMPTAHWTFDNQDLVDGSPRDVIGNFNAHYKTAQTGNASYLTSGQSFRFRYNNQMVSVDGHPDLEFGNQMTVATWVKFDSFNIYGIVTYGDSAATGGADGEAWTLLTRPNGTVTFRVNNGQEIEMTGLSVNTWYHVAASFDSGNIKLYLNGAEVANGTVAETTIPVVPNSYLVFGNHHPWTQNHFAGYMDQVLLWDQAVPPSTINQIYQSWVDQAPVDLRAPEPITNPTVTDETTDGFTLSWSASPNLQGDLFGYRVYLDGTEVAVTDAVTTSYSFTGLQPFTEYLLEVAPMDAGDRVGQKTAITGITAALDQSWLPQPRAWYTMDNADGSTDAQQRHNSNYRSNTTGTGGIVNQSNRWTSSSHRFEVPDDPSLIDGNQFSMSFWYHATDIQTRGILGYGTASNEMLGVHQNNHANGRFLALSVDGTELKTGRKWARDGRLTQVLSTNRWHHVAFTIDGNLATLYFNGDKVVETTLPIASIQPVIDGWLSLGHRPRYTQNFYGYLDEVMIWNQALGSGAVRAIYQKNAAGQNFDMRPPEVPTSLKARPGNQELLLSWTTPTATAAEVAHFLLSVNDGPEIQIAANQTGYTLTGLLDDTVYDLSLVSVDALGNRSVAAQTITATLPATHAEIPKPYHYYSLDNGRHSSGKAYDLMYRQHANYASVTTGQGGMAGQSFRWTSSSHRVEVPDTGSMLPTDKFSVALWARMSNFSNRSLITHGNGSAETFAVVARNTGQGNYVRLIMTPTLLDYGATMGGNNRVARQLSANRWYHIALVYDTGQLRFYVDGRRVGEAAATPQNLEDVWLSFGRRPSTNWSFSGYQDEIGLWHEALDDASVALIYQSGLHGNSIDLTPPEWVSNLQASTTADSATISWTHSADSLGDLDHYRLEFEGKAPVTVLKTSNSATVNGLLPLTRYNFKVFAVDSSGNEAEGRSGDCLTLPAGHHGLPAPEAYYTFDNADISSAKPLDVMGRHHANYGTATTGQSGVIDKSFRFTSSSHKVEVPDMNGLVSGDKVTMVTWIKAQDFSNRNVFAHGNSSANSFLINAINSGGYQFEVEVNGTKLKHGALMGGNGVLVSQLNTYQWYQLAFVYDLGNLSMYLDGKLVGQTTANLQIAVNAWLVMTAKPTSGYFYGYLDETILWNHALTETQIGLLYQTWNQGQPLDIRPPENISNPKVEADTNQLTLEWTHSANTHGDLDHYRVVFEGQADQQVPAIQASLNVTGLLPLTSYDYTIYSVDALGNESNGVNGIAVTLPDTPAQFTRPEAWYTYEDADRNGSLAYDRMDTHDAYYGSLSTGQSGMVGKSFRLTSSSHKLRIHNDPSLIGSQAMTYASWFRASNFSNRNHVMLGNDSSEVFNLSLQNSSGDHIRLEIGAGNQLTAGSIWGHNNRLVSDMYDTWYHVAFTYDQGTVKLYLNGRKVNEASWAVDLLTAPADSYLGFGRRENPTRYSSTYLDETVLWPEALTEEQIGLLHQLGRKGYDFDGPQLDLQPPEVPTSLSVVPATDGITLNWTASVDSFGDLSEYRLYLDGAHVADVLPGVSSYLFPTLTADTTYTLGISSRDTSLNESRIVTLKAATLDPAGIADPVAYWTFDTADKAGNEHQDLVGVNDTSYTVANSATGKVGEAIRIDSSSYESRVDAPVLNLTDKLTVSAWIRPVNITNNGGYITLGSETQDVFSLIFVNDASNGHRFGFQTNKVTDLQIIRTDQHTAGDGTVLKQIDIHKWYHVAAIFDQGQASLYLNGELQETATWNLAALPVAVDPKLYFGRYHVGTDIKAYNYLDETAIWNSALTPEDVLVLYHRGVRGERLNSQPAAKDNVVAGEDYDYLVLEDGHYRFTGLDTEKSLWLYNAVLEVEDHLRAADIHLMEGSVITHKPLDRHEDSPVIEADLIEIDTTSRIDFDGLAGLPDDLPDVSPLYPNRAGRGDRAGGAVSLKSCLLILDGAVSARGLDGDGGSILIETDMISGSGVIDVSADNGAGGRVAVHANNALSFEGRVITGSERPGSVVFEQHGDTLQQGTRYPFKQDEAVPIEQLSFSLDVPIEPRKGKDGYTIEVDFDPQAYLGLWYHYDGKYYRVREIRQTTSERRRLYLQEPGR
ncbi:MAG: carboxypeptidase regulatory-like domain-containing protein [Acidobacteriota bacterium]|nr:carboxypeptidase regulatory-like domain-containing protein [Acidobacteriota bacterium]